MAVTKVMIDHIRQRRRELNITQAQLGAAVDCSAAEISLIERGRRNISLGRFLRIVDALKINIAPNSQFGSDFLYF